MKYFKRFLTGIVLASAATLASAQTPATGYFLDNYLYRFELNPALGNSYNYISWPAVGNFNAGVEGNLHLNSLVHSYNGKPVYFTNPNISNQDAMSRFKNTNFIGTDLKMNLLSLGFKGFGGYTNIAFSSSIAADASIPKSFFALLKEGVSNGKYEIDGIRIREQAYSSVAINHSHEFDFGLKIGATAKYHVGLSLVDAHLNKAHLVLDQQDWNITSQAELYASQQNDFEYNSEPGKEKQVTGFSFSSNPVNTGKGFSLDLGAEYKWNFFKLSASVTDIGYIDWQNIKRASTNGERNFSLSKYSFSVTGDNQETLDQMEDDLASLYQLQDDGGRVNYNGELPRTINLGLDIAIPGYERLHFGILSSSRSQGQFSWNDLRVSANFNPINFLALSGSAVMGDHGFGYGGMLNICCKGINLFVGMDNIPSKLLPPSGGTWDYFPLTSNLSLNAGLNIPF